MKLIDYQQRAENFEAAAERLKNLIERASGMRQVLPIVIQLPVEMYGQTVMLTATVPGVNLGRYEVSE